MSLGDGPEFVGSLNEDGSEEDPSTLKDDVQSSTEISKISIHDKWNFEKSESENSTSEIKERFRNTTSRPFLIKMNDSSVVWWSESVVVIQLLTMTVISKKKCFCEIDRNENDDTRVDVDFTRNRIIVCECRTHVFCDVFCWDTN